MNTNNNYQIVEWKAKHGYKPIKYITLYSFYCGCIQPCGSYLDNNNNITAEQGGTQYIFSGGQLKSIFFDPALYITHLQVRFI